MTAIEEYLKWNEGNEDRPVAVYFRPGCDSHINLMQSHLRLAARIKDADAEAVVPR